MVNPEPKPRHRTLRLTKFWNKDRPVRFGLGRLFLWFTLAAIFFGMFAWLNRWQSLTISGDTISKYKKYRIETLSTDLFVESVLLRITGEINSRATIILGDSDQEYSVGPGKIDIDIGPCDFYYSKGEIQYTPQNVSEGHLKFQYRFH